MTIYNKITDFAAKDALLTGNPSKIVKGTEIGAEFDSIAAADATSVKTGGAASVSSVTDSGNLTFTGTGNRITGDFSNATVANRVMFQTSTVNGQTVMGVIPNGSGIASRWIGFSNSDVNNSSYLAVSNDGSTSIIDSNKTGTGTYLPITFYTGGSERMRIDASGNVGIGGAATYKLDVVGSDFRLNPASGNVAMRYARGGVNKFTTYVDGVTDAFIFYSDASTAERMRIDTSGNVGIGKTPVTHKLEVSSANGYIKSEGTGASGGFLATSVGGIQSIMYAYDTNGVVGFGAASNHPLTLLQNNQEKMRIDTSGNVTFQATGSAVNNVASINGGQLAGFRNRVINGNFGINQRGVSGTVTLAAGIYGHDRWKAGAGGCTYTFATVNNVTTITISAGTLQQVIEGLNLESGTFKLSWTGTATGRVDSGSYGASGVVGTAVGGTNQTIEFATGTVSKVMYEFGSVATTFEQRPYGTELDLCQRYYYRETPGANQYYSSQGLFDSTTSGRFFTKFPTPMRIAPTSVETSGTASHYSISGAGISPTCSSVPTHVTQGITTMGLVQAAVASGLTTGQAGLLASTVTGGSGYLGWSAEL
jgi:hypothetical protein